MKFLAWFGGGFWLGVCTALAQVTAEVTFEYDQYLSNEPIRAGVRITNFSGQTLKLGEDPDWLDVNVEMDDGFLTNRTGDPPVVEPFELPSSSRATRWVDLVPYFNLGKVGRYKVVATVRIRELGIELNTKPTPITITSGAKVWQQDFGLRTTGASDPTSVEVRRYALVQSMNQKKVALYCRLTDASEVRVYRVFSLGSLLTFSHPEAQVDRTGQLHVLFQTSARHFTYAVVSPDGDLLVRQDHQYTASRPILRAKDDGSIVVYGGVRIVTSSDIPKPELAPSPMLEKSVAPTPVTPTPAPTAPGTPPPKADPPAPTATPSDPSKK